jgi:hypothetical protein
MLSERGAVIQDERKNVITIKEYTQSGIFTSTQNTK